MEVCVHVLPGDSDTRPYAAHPGCCTRDHDNGLPRVLDRSYRLPPLVADWDQHRGEVP
jgi:hypothetical protein